MGFRKTFKAGSNIKFNLSSSGLSTTIGGRGNSFNMGSKGAFLNWKVPGTKISGRMKLSGEDSIKQDDDRAVIHTKVVGVTHKNIDGVSRQSVLRRMKDRGYENEQIRFIHEADNPKDENAIKVINSEGECLGYLNKRLAADVVGFIDSLDSPLCGYISEITGGTDEAKNLGCNIVIPMTLVNDINHTGKTASLLILHIILGIISGIVSFPALIFGNGAMFVIFFVVFVFLEIMLKKSKEEGTQ